MNILSVLLSDTQPTRGLSSNNYFLVKLQNTNCLLNAKGKLILEKIPFNWKSFISEFHPTIDISKVIETAFIDVLYGGRYYVSIGIDVVIWLHPDFTSNRIFDCYDDLVFFIKHNGVENV